MYNVNKGKNTPNESEILEPLHACLREILEREHLNLTPVEYTDDDIVAATLMYATILSNRFGRILKEEKASIELCKELAAHFGIMINETTLAMTRVDTSKYYKEREKK